MNSNATFRGDADASEPPTPVSSPQKGNSRKGKGAKQKAAEKFRAYRNEKTDKDVIQARLEKFKLEHSYGTPLSEIIDTNISITSPPQEIALSNDFAPTLVQDTMQTLLVKKVAPLDLPQDTETMMLAMALQLEVKQYYATVGSGFLRQQNHERAILYEDLATALDTAPLPIAVYVDQIGKCVVDGQTFYPFFDDEHSFTYHRAAAPMGRNHPLRQIRCFNNDEDPFVGMRLLDARGEPTDEVVFAMDDEVSRQVLRELEILVDGIWNEEFLRDPARYAIEASGAIRIVFPHFRTDTVPRFVVPTVQEIKTRYTRLIQRIESKNTKYLVPLNLKSGVGACSQLAVSDVERADGYAQVWSPRRIAPDMLCLGGALRFAVVQPLTMPQIAAIRADYDVRNAAQRLQSLLTRVGR